MYIFFPFITLILSCSSAGRVKARNIEESFSIIWQSALQEIEPYGIKINDKKKRIIKSEYFESNYTDKKSVERSQIIIQISQSRPYSIFIDVDVQLQYETRGLKYFENFTYNLEKAEEVLRNIMEKVKKKKDKVNFFKEFTPF